MDREAFERLVFELGTLSNVWGRLSVAGAQCGIAEEMEALTPDEAANIAAAIEAIDAAQRSIEARQSACRALLIRTATPNPQR
jgi:hypothetical protein